jgi:uncharacterized protein (DUF486 family)
MIPVLIAALVLLGTPALYFALKSREFRKFLSGAFFVSAGLQFYFYINDVSMPLIATDIVQTPELSGVRSVIHFALFLVTLYFGFIQKPKSPKKKK